MASNSVSGSRSVDTAAPHISVVVPAFNGAGSLARCLRSLCAQTYPHSHYEIILVDDGSTDETAALARAMAAEWDGGILRVIEKANGGPASARNAGLRASHADIITFTDADCVAAPDWLEQVVRVLVASDAAGVGGPIVNVTPPGWVAGYLTSAQFYRHRLRRGGVDYLLTANVAFRRAALLAVDGFTEQPGAWAEDADLSFRLKHAGFGLLLAQQGIVTHFGTPASVRGLMRELYRYGRGSAVLSVNWHNGRTPSRECVRHAAGMVLAPWLALRRWRQGRVGFWRALSFCPLVLLEHAAFIVGLMSGVAETRLARSNGDG